MLSQLSYSPTRNSSYRRLVGLSKGGRAGTRAAGGVVSGLSGGVVSCLASGWSGEIGIRRGLKIPRLHGRAGSNPASGTI